MFSLVPIDDTVDMSTGRQIYYMWNVENGEVIDFPENKSSGGIPIFYLINPELIIAYDNGAEGGNEITAYRPDKK